MAFHFTTVPGFFAQSESSTDPLTSPAILPRLGLIDDSTSRWQKFVDRIEALNKEAPPGTTYKVLFLGRHGQGYHNVAESFYGTQAWDDHWSHLDTDGNLVWGPDPDLTEVGISQAHSANAIWKEELPLGVPLPESLYSSPLLRAAHTAELTFGDVIFHERTPRFVEAFRESIGIHTCDKRRSASLLRERFPAFTFEPNFSDPDVLWLPDVRETFEEEQARVRAGLDKLFKDDKNTFVSITAHSGTIKTLLAVVGHRRYPLHTGGALAVVVKAVAA